MRWMIFLTQSLDGLLYGNSNQSNAMNSINAAKGAMNSSMDSMRNNFSNQQSYNVNADNALRKQITDSYSNYLNPENINSMFSNLDSTNLSSFASGDFSGANYIPGVSGGIDQNLITNMGAVPYGEYSKMSQQGNDYINPDFMKNFNTSMGSVDMANKSYEDFINSGGFSQSDIDAMRAQGSAPTRQIYANAQANMDTANARAGGNLGNIGAVQAKMSNDAADKIGAANTTTEANLAQMRQQGKEFGTTGLAQTSLAKAQAQTAVQQLDAQLKEAGLAGMTDIEKTRLMGELQNAQINMQAGAANANIALGKAGLSERAIEAMAGIDQAKAQLPLTATAGLNQLYGTTPGASNMSNNNMLALQSLFNSGNLGLLNAQINAGHLPGNFSSFLGNLGSIFGLGGQGAGALGGIMSLFSNGGGQGAGQYNPYIGDYTSGGGGGVGDGNPLHD